MRLERIYGTSDKIIICYKKYLYSSLHIIFNVINNWINIMVNRGLLNTYIVKQMNHIRIIKIHKIKNIC